MPIGPGRYDEECSRARIATNARGVILIVIDGKAGSGFSCQADIITTLQLPDILDTVAKEIRASRES